jgi:probable phosphoglycerate mutase
VKHLLVEADGGSRGNPGPAGYGAVVRDADTGQVLARRNGFLGTATNNVAEYRGLIAGLQAATALEPSARVVVRMDSKLVVEQMSGRWQIKHPAMRPLAKQAADLVARFPAVSFTWIPRAQNGEADRLANAAMDARRATYDALDDTPESHPAPAEPAAPAASTWADPVSTAPTVLLLLRHGQTALSVERRFSGAGDPPLTERGSQQAQAVARRLARRGGIDAIITSPLARARATAETVGRALGLTAHVDAAWRECDFGAFEGLTFAEARKKHPAAVAAWLADAATPPPNGESFAAVTSRVVSARDAVVAAGPGRTVLIVSHVTPIKVLARLALDGPPSTLFALHLDLTALSEVQLQADGKAVLRRWNDTAHLED